MTHALEMTLIRTQRGHPDGRIIDVTPLPRTHLREPPSLEPLAQLRHETTRPVGPNRLTPTAQDRHDPEEVAGGDDVKMIQTP